MQNPSLSHVVCYEPNGDTFFSADAAYLIDTRELTADELEAFNDGTHTQRLQLLDKYGKALN